jgi:hypothetical protein
MMPYTVSETFQAGPLSHWLVITNLKNGDSPWRFVELQTYLIGTRTLEELHYRKAQKQKTAEACH